MFPYFYSYFVIVFAAWYMQFAPGGGWCRPGFRAYSCAKHNYVRMCKGMYLVKRMGPVSGSEGTAMDVSVSVELSLSRSGYCLITVLRTKIQQAD
jgi:hypothetical protein